MLNAETSIPVIDIFAGPGGLSEGFSTFAAEKRHPFRVALSIETEQWAHRTLLLRAFVRHWLPSGPPAQYYRFLRGEIAIDDLLDVAGQARREIEQEAWRATLGRTDPDEIDDRIHSALRDRGSWILIGGPPCQAYSVVGRSRRRRVDPRFEEDPKHFLYREYLRILRRHQPPLFFMENVRGILSSTIKGERVFDMIVDDLRASGYRLYSCVAGSQLPDIQVTRGTDFVIRAEEFGVPQRRHRVIILGVRNDLPDVGAEQLLVPERARMTVRQALSGLPRLRSRLSVADDSDEEWRRTIALTPWQRMRLDPEVLSEMIRCSQELRTAAIRSTRNHAQDRRSPEFARDSRLDLHCNHEPRGHIADDIRRYFFAAVWAEIKGVSPRLQDFPSALLPSHANVAAGVAGEIFADRFRVQVGSAPATTVTSHIAKDGHYFIHYDPRQARSLTVREAARLQTFPDNYFFMGPRTSQYQQVGNAVPPLLARSLAGIAHGIISRHVTSPRSAAVLAG